MAPQLRRRACPTLIRPAALRARPQPAASNAVETPRSSGRPTTSLHPQARCRPGPLPLLCAVTEPSADSDEDLMARVVQRDQHALADLYHRHGGRVLGLARTVLGDQARAEEITQAVFLRIWERPEAFDPTRGKLRSYLLTIAHTRALDVIRSEKARVRREEVDHQRGEPLRAADIEDRLSDLRVDVQGALARLPEGERAAIVTAYFGGYTYQQVAELLGEAEGTVKSRIRSGLLRLREMNELSVPADPGALS